MAGLIALPFAAQAQPVAQDWEVILGGTGGADSDFDRGAFGATLSLGYYLTDNWEIVGRQNLNYASSGQWIGKSTAAIDYNFHMDKLVPFLGANVGYAFGNRGIADTWGVAPEAGLKFYLQDKAFLFGMAEYQFPFAGKFFEDGRWQFTVGIGVNL